MRGVRRTERGVEVVDVPTPSGGVRVAVTSAGICGSDFHLIAAGPLPHTLGHEFGGVLDDGTAVAVRPNATCGTCAACTSGRSHLCAAALGRFYGVSIDGGLADEVGVDPACLVPLPAAFDPADAALAEPVAVAVHGIRRFGVTAGQRVLIIGAGPIGLCAIAAALDAGADVDVEARRAFRREAAARLGAGPATAPTYDLVVDAAGTTESAALAVDRVAPGGTVGMLGTWWDPASLDGTWQLKEVSLVPGFLYGPPDFAAAVALLGSVPALHDVVVTHRFALDDAAEAFRVAADRSSGAIKVLLHP